MSDDNELYIAGRLIQWALRPHARPTAESEYRELLDRYLEQLQFRDAVRAIASGLGLQVIDANLLGVVLVPTEDSIFAAKSSDYRPAANAEERLIDGLIQVAIIATIYPRAHDLEEDSAIARPPITVEDVEETLRNICDRLEDASRGLPDTVANDRATGLYEAWRVYREKASAKTTDNARVSPATTRRAIERSLEFLQQQGCFTHSSHGSREEYRPTWRYQVMIQEWSATHIYNIVRSQLDSSSI